MAEAGFLKKMRWKGDGNILLVNLPDVLMPLMDFIHDKSDTISPAGLVILFVRNSAEVNHYSDALQSLDLSKTVLWLAYPKKSSRITSDLSRDILWNMMRGLGLTGVSLISLNSDWSVARYKPESDVTHSPKGSLDVPPEVVELLRTDDAAREFFYALPASHRKEYIVWIRDAKRPETKERRLSRLIEMLHKGLRNPSEKSS